MQLTQTLIQHDLLHILSIKAFTIYPYIYLSYIRYYMFLTANMSWLIPLIWSLLATFISIFFLVDYSPEHIVLSENNNPNQSPLNNNEFSNGGSDNGSSSNNNNNNSNNHTVNNSTSNPEDERDSDGRSGYSGDTHSEYSEGIRGRVRRTDFRERSPDPRMVREIRIPGQVNRGSFEFPMFPGRNCRTPMYFAIHRIMSSEVIARCEFCRDDIAGVSYEDYTWVRIHTHCGHASTELNNHCHYCVTRDNPRIPSPTPIEGAEQLNVRTPSVSPVPSAPHWHGSNTSSLAGSRPVSPTRINIPWPNPSSNSHSPSSSN